MSARVRGREMGNVRRVLSLALCGLLLFVVSVFAAPGKLARPGQEPTTERCGSCHPEFQ